jgi:opacity protein-like surface antigen
MQKTLLPILFLTTLSLQAIAAPSFEGLSVSAGLGIVGTNTDHKQIGIGDNVDDGVDVDSNIGDVTGVARIDVSYLKAINNNFLIGLGATYDFNDIKSTQKSSSDDMEDYPIHLKLKNHFSLYAQPTYILREGTAVFGKIGYHHVDASYEDTYNLNYQTGATKQGLHGLGLGLGLQTFVTDNAFIKVEGNYIHYLTESPENTNGAGDSYKVELKSDQAEGVISVGYKF